MLRNMLRHTTASKITGLAVVVLMTAVLIPGIQNNVKATIFGQPGQPYDPSGGSSSGGYGSNSQNSTGGPTGGNTDGSGTQGSGGGPIGGSNAGNLGCCENGSTGTGNQGSGGGPIGGNTTNQGGGGSPIGGSTGTSYTFGTGSSANNDPAPAPLPPNSCCTTVSGHPEGICCNNQPPSPTVVVFTTPPPSSTPPPVVIQQTAPKITVQKTGPTQAVAGSQIAYVITVKSIGNDTANNVNITDTYPSDMTFFSAVGQSCQDNFSQRKISCSFGNMSAGQELRVTVNFNILSNAVCKNFTNSVEATGNNVSTVTTTATTATNCPSTLVCSPTSQNIPIYANANFTASGGIGNYSWSAPGASITAGNSASFATTYNSTGSKTITVTSGTQTAYCSVNISNINTLTCGPAYQNLTVGQTGSFTASGGDGIYSWYAAGATILTGSGSVFSTAFNSTGGKTITVSSSGQSAVCSANVIQQNTTGVITSKSAFNDTKNRDATTINASREDFITYSLSARNTGSIELSNYIFTDDLSGVLPLADIVDFGSGSLSGQTINYPAINIPAGSTVTKTFKVRVKYSLSPAISYQMLNTYGNAVVITINPPPVYKPPRTGGMVDLASGAGFATLATGLLAIIRRKKLLGSMPMNP